MQWKDSSDLKPLSYQPEMWCAHCAVSVVCQSSGISGEPPTQLPPGSPRGVDPRSADFRKIQVQLCCVDP